MRFEWNTSMASGNATIDEQHRKLINTLNLLLDEMAAGQGKQEIEAILKWLADYAVKHFAYEEGCMQQHRYPFAAQNKIAHAEFLRTFTDLHQQFRDNGPSTALVLAIEQKLAAWVQTHIRKIDTNLAPRIQSRAA